MRLPYVRSSKERQCPHRRSLQAFYVPNKDRPNLKVLINATAHRINTQPSANCKLSAISVEFEYDGKIHTVNVQKDVCLTAG